VLECADLAAQRRLGQVQVFGRAREIPKARHGHKGSQLVEVHFNSVRASRRQQTCIGVIEPGILALKA
jgi:hypothetical protein